MDNSFDLFNWLWMVLGAPIAWFWKAVGSLSTKVDDLKDKQAAHELKVAEDYITAKDYKEDRQQFRDALDKIVSHMDVGFQRIEDKLDGKVDKR